MKNQLWLLVLLFVVSAPLTAQKNCENTLENPLGDLNSITLKKCAAKTSSKDKQIENLKKVRQIQIKSSSFNNRFLTKRKKSEVTSLSSNVNSHGVEKTAIDNIDLLKKEVIIVSKNEDVASTIYTFNEVDKVPLFKECKNLHENVQRTCFNNQITSFITDNIEYPEDAYDDELKGIVSVKFTINKDGEIADVFVTQSAEGAILKDAVTELITRLPKFIPAQKLSQNVATKYEFSLNFSL